MVQKEYRTKRGRFQHLTSEKRAQIEILLRMKKPKRQIAKAVGISHSTLYNELARGTVTQLDSELRTYQRYFADAGQRVYEAHRQNSRPPLKLVKAHDFIPYAEKQMRPCETLSVNIGLLPFFDLGKKLVRHIRDEAH